MFKSIFSRIFWTNILIVCVVSLSVSIAMSFFIQSHFINNQYRTVEKVNEVIESELNNSIFNSFSTLSFSRSLRDKATILDSDIIIFDRGGAIVESTTDSIYNVPMDYVDNVLEGKAIRKKSTYGGAYASKRYIVIFPIRYNNNIIGGISYNMRMRYISKNINIVRFVFIITLMLSIFFTFVLLFRQSKKISDPLRKINKAAMKIASGNFEERVPVESGDEIGQLASTFNFMANSLENQDRLRNRFISDVSHELRTPMTSISGFVGGMLDGTIPTERQDEYLQIVKDESERLTKMVNEMLEMSKMSAKEYKLNVSKFDINELIRRCIIELEQKITDHNLDLNVDFAMDSIRVIADEDAIKRVMINLLDNAIKFSNGGTAIQLKTEVKNSLAYITVGNFGKGIEKQELDSIFDRFYKSDSSRHNTPNNGAGLGLSFVKNIMNMHKQTVYATSNVVGDEGLKYTTFVFTLELA